MRYVIAWCAALACAGAIAATPEQEKALLDIDAFAAAQQKTDPHYAKVEAELMGRVDEMVKTVPTAEWVPTIRRWYFGLSEKAAADEQARIRAEERANAGPPSRSPADRYIDRLEALEKDLQAGKIGPREHALHALEAARLIYPQDGALHALREAKVPLATNYELGRITRVQYDEGWAAARARYQQAAGARDAEIASQAAPSPAPTAARTLADRLRKGPAINCTGTSGALGTSTTCR